MFTYQNNPWNLKYEQSNSVLLNAKELERQCYIKKVVPSQKTGGIEKTSNTEIGNVNYTRNLSQKEAMLDETSFKIVPNILRRHSKLNKQIFSQLNGTDRKLTFADENYTQFTSTANCLSENKCFKKETKYKHIPNRRKQGFGFTDVWHESLNWNICSFDDDDENKISDKCFFAPVKLKTSIKQRKIKQCTKQQDKKNCQKKEDLFPISDNISEDFTHHCVSLYSLQEIKSMDLEDSIDFSSNEIFNKFNYEFYGNDSLSCYTEYVMDNSLSTTCDSDITEKEYDEAEYKLSKSKSPISEYLDTDILFWDDQKLNWSYDSYCDHCFENCASSWITTNEVKSDILLKDRMLTAPIYKSVYHTTNEINMNYLDVDNMYLANDSPIATENKKLSSTNCTKHLSLTGLLTHYDEYDTKEKILEETINSNQREKHQIFNHFDDTFFEIDFAEQAVNEYSTNSLKINEADEYSPPDKIFQCSLCLLTFSNPRTMAMHRAGAHGGAYAILCESCGRLFNRKYHFNRHFVHCGPTKKPFKCDKCMKRYRHKSSLIYHLKDTHKIDNVCKDSTKFICNTCNKIYKKFGAFKNHIKKHQDTARKLLNYCDDL